MKTKSPFSSHAYFARWLFALSATALTSGTILGNIIVVPTGNAGLLANKILGSGVTIVGTPTLTGGNLDNNLSSAATFTGGLSTGIGIDSGILLTSGHASNVSSTNTSDSITGDFGGAGNAALNSLIPDYVTFDATVLDFQFTTTTGNLYFNFSFGSEEYNEWANTIFNDVFGFFVDGKNIALLPGTNIPISIDNINGGNPFGTNPQHPNYFHNNAVADGGPFYNFEYDGFTSVFTVSALGLGTGTHSISLAIADAGDHILDSGVFIQAQSFGDDPTPLDDDPTHHKVPDATNSLYMSLAGLLCLALFRSRTL